MVDSTGVPYWQGQIEMPVAVAVAGSDRGSYLAGLFHCKFKDLRMCLSTIALAKVEGPTPRFAWSKGERHD